MKLIAFDSGLERTGWAVFDMDGRNYALLAYNCIFTSRDLPLSGRIYSLSSDVQNLVKLYQPEEFVLEQLFFLANKKTAIQVAQAQGAVLGIAGQHGIKVSFLTPPQIKSSLSGYGKTDKKGIQKMVSLLLHIDPLPTPDDTVDAIACGLTYCTMMKPNI